MKQFKLSLILPVAVILSVFILVEVNYPFLKPQSRLALFALLGLIVVFFKYPLHPKLEDNRFLHILDFVLVGLVILCFGYVIIQTEPAFKKFWLKGAFLGERASDEHIMDYFIAAIGLLLILEATRRAIGLTLTILAGAFILYALLGQFMPSWLFQHRGYSLKRVVSKTFLHGGVFGVALRVMFTYVFLFVLFGTFLERTGATAYILNLARKIFGSSKGSPAKVAVIGSGMMGSLSGSAVANTATTGTFTIPLMRSVGFKPEIAGGIEAAASSGGALVPPIMGAAAYMMLEIVEPSVTYLEIIKAALIPAIFYYTALLLIVHFYAKRISNNNQLTEEEINTEKNANREDVSTEKLPKIQGVVFFAAFFTLIIFLLKLPGADLSGTDESPFFLSIFGFLLQASTPYRAVSWALLVVLVVSLFHPKTRVGLSGIIGAMNDAAHSGVSLIAAASCVGIILGVVELTAIGTEMAATMLSLAKTNILFALFLLMISTIILGMGLPSSVCYLLVAILMGPVLLNLGLEKVVLAVHFFIFYFGMMSMVTPPVALAAYTAAAIADANIMKTAFAAFRFALVGFALPYTFVLRPELLLLGSEGGNPEVLNVIISFLLTLSGTIIFAVSMAGHAFKNLTLWERGILFISVIILFFVPTKITFIWIHGLALLAATLIFYYNWGKGRLMMKAALKGILYSLLVLLFILHNDFWLWDNHQNLLGLPIGLLYHIVFCIVASILMFFLVKYSMNNSKKND